MVCITKRSEAAVPTGSLPDEAAIITNLGPRPGREWHTAISRALTLAPRNRPGPGPQDTGAACSESVESGWPPTFPVPAGESSAASSRSNSEQLRQQLYVANLLVLGSGQGGTRHGSSDDPWPDPETPNHWQAGSRSHSGRLP